MIPTRSLSVWPPHVQPWTQWWEEVKQDGGHFLSRRLAAPGSWLQNIKKSTTQWEKEEVVVQWRPAEETGQGEQWAWQLERLRQRAQRREVGSFWGKSGGTTWDSTQLQVSISILALFSFSFNMCILITRVRQAPRVWEFQWRHQSRNPPVSCHDLEHKRENVQPKNIRI